MTGLKSDHIPAVLFFCIAAAVCYLSYKLIMPFLTPLVWAAVFAILFNPVHRNLQSKLKRPVAAAMASTLIVLIVIAGPVTLLLLQLVSEAGEAVTRINAMYRSGELQQMMNNYLPSLDYAKERLSGWVDLSASSVSEMADNAVQKISNLVLSQTKAVVSGSSQFVMHFLLMAFSLYYFFKDGQAIVARLQKLVPLEQHDVTHTFRELRELILATMYSGILVAVVQGIAGGILFAAVGVPSAVFWGSVMAFLSVLPFVGAFLVYVPAGLILIMTGSTTSGIIVLVVGGGVISQIDNFLRPVLVANRSTMHPMILFFSMIGGVGLLGLVGIVLGPVIAALLLTVLRILELSVTRNRQPASEVE